MRAEACRSSRNDQDTTSPSARAHTSAVRSGEATAWRSTAFQAAFRRPPANQLTSPSFISPTKASSGGRSQSSRPASRSQKRRGLSRLSTASRRQPSRRSSRLHSTRLLLTLKSDRGRQAMRQPAFTFRWGLRRSFACRSGTGRYRM